jgi:5-methylcytosine-specific restriction endonuclease McrA
MAPTPFSDPAFLFQRGGVMAKRRNGKDASLVAAIQQSKSIAGVLRLMGMRVGGGNYATIKRCINELRVDTSHWTGQGHRKGSVRPVVAARPLQSILVRGSAYHSDKLRRRLIREMVFEHRCAGCRLSDWLGSKIPLELDHKDGDRSNNVLENLRLLCPNCHALTPTYRGRNARKKRE